MTNDQCWLYLGDISTLKLLYIHWLCGPIIYSLTLALITTEALLTVMFTPSTYGGVDSQLNVKLSSLQATASNLVLQYVILNT